jgi:hypothetical protein
MRVGNIPPLTCILVVIKGSQTKYKLNFAFI